MAQTVGGSGAGENGENESPREKEVSGTEVTPELLDAYKRILTYQFSGAALLITALSAAVLASYLIAQLRLPFILLVMLSGMLGAFFSALTRLYNIDQISVALISPLATKLDGRHLLMYSFVPLMVGAIGSVALYWGFVSKLVEGGLFPKLCCKGEAMTCTQLVEVLNNYGPKEAADYGKVLIWAVIAGFSERFVPDLLQSLAAQSQNDRRHAAR